MSRKNDAAEIERLGAALLEKDELIETLKAEVHRLERESRERWEAIERLAPTAKRLRMERDRLRAQLQGRDSESTSTDG